MPFPVKIQPIDSNIMTGTIRNEAVKPIVKSRFKRLFEHKFSNVLRISSTDKPCGGEIQCNKDLANDLEPSSVCLAKMVQNFLEESNEKQSVAAKCGRNRCSCFNGNCTDSSDDDYEFCRGFGDSINGEICDILKSLVPCVNIIERNLLSDTGKIVEKNKVCKRRDDFRKIITEGLLALGYNASICKSRWEKTSSFPAGEHEYIDVIIEEDRLLVDIDFRSEFEIARSTSQYKSVLQSLPVIFVGKADRLKEIVSIVSEAAKQSLKKKGMPLPPWRKSEYMRSKWLSPHTRTTIASNPIESTIGKPIKSPIKTENQSKTLIKTKTFSGEFELFFNEKKKSEVEVDKSKTDDLVSETEEKITVVVSAWTPPAVKPKSSPGGSKVIGSGLASVLKEKP